MPRASASNFDQNRCIFPFFNMKQTIHEGFLVGGMSNQYHQRADTAIHPLSLAYKRLQTDQSATKSDEAVGSYQEDW